MANYNEITISLRVSFDTKSFGKVTSTACSYYNGKDQDGKYRNAFITIKQFSNQPFMLKKGEEINVTGRISFEEYTDKNGVKHSNTIIIANHIEPNTKTKKDNHNNYNQVQEEAQVEDDDIPF